MTNRDFDAMLRASAKQEVIDVSPRMKELIQSTISNPASTRRIRRFTTKTLVLAAIIALLLATVAYAAINAPGLLDIYSKWYGKDSDVATSLQQYTAQPQETVYELPDVTITLTEVLYDGFELHATGTVAPKEGSNVVIMSENYLPQDPYSIDSHFGEEVSEGTPTYAEKAAETGATLLRTYVSVRVEGSGGGMQDYMQRPDGIYSFIGTAENAAVTDNEEIEVTLVAFQEEVNSEGYALDGTRSREEWHFTVPALIAADPTPTPTIVGDDALIVYGDGDGSPSHQAFLVIHPDAEVAFDSKRMEGGDKSNELLQLMDETLEWDVMALNWQEVLCLPELAERGLIADLSASETIAQATKAMYPAIQAYLTYEGVPYGVPTWPHSNRFITPIAENFAEIGIADARHPETLGDLLDLIEQYLDIPQEQRQNRALYHAELYHEWLATYALDMQTLLHMREGTTPVYNTGDMLALMERIQMLCERLPKEEKRVNVEKMMLEETTLPTRPFESSPIVIEASASVYVVNPQSARLGMAMDYVTATLAATNESYSEELYMPDDAQSSEYANQVAPYLWIAPQKPYYHGDKAEEYHVLLSRYMTGEIGTAAFLDEMTVLVAK